MTQCGPCFYHCPAALLICLLFSAEVVAAEEIQDRLQYETDLRVGLSSNRRSERDASNPVEYSVSARLRHGATASIAESWQLKVRAAAIADNNVERLRVSLDGPIITGDVTLDTLHFVYRPSETLTVNIGRLQTEFELDSVIKDSLSRHDSSGVTVDWTDGIHMIVGREDAVRLHFITQTNHERESTNGVGTQGPASYEDDSARHTYYLGLELPESGVFTQLLADITVIPEALYPLGLDEGTREALAALTLKAAADVMVGDFKLHPFLEAGVMLSTPLNNVLDLQDGSRSHAGKFAVITGFDLVDVGPGDVGIQISWIQPGFLISPDYPANSTSVEARYEWAFGRNAVFDIRYRYREDMKRNLTSRVKRRDRNVQARISMAL